MLLNAAILLFALNVNLSGEKEEKHGQCILMTVSIKICKICEM